MRGDSIIWGGSESPPMSPKSRIAKIKKEKNICDRFSPSEIKEAELDPVELETQTILKQVTPQQRYWFYIEKGFPDNAVENIEKITKDNIFKLLPSQLANNVKLGPTIQQLESEVEYNHVTAMKQGIIDYILIDPNERIRLEIPPVLDRYEIVTARAPVPWHDSLTSLRAGIKESLFITNPVMKSLLEIFAKFENLRIVDTSVLTSSILPISINEFQIILKNQCTVFKNRILNEWIPTVANVFLSTKDSWYRIASDCADVDLGFQKLGKMNIPF